MSDPDNRTRLRATTDIETPFGSTPRSRGLRPWLLFGAVVAASVLSLLTRNNPTATAPDASAFSVSAIGHHAFVAWLERIGPPPTVERSRPLRHAGPGRGLLMLAPNRCDTDIRCHRLTATVRGAAKLGSPIILALPRWDATPEERRPAFASGLSGWPDSDVAELLSRIVMAATTDTRPTTIETFVTPDFIDAAWEAEAFRVATTGTFVEAGTTADTAGSWFLVQPSMRLIRKDAPMLEPVIVAADNGDMLVGRIEGTSVHVVSDADIFGNAWLASGDDAALLQWLLVQKLQLEAVIVDETIHDHYLPPSLWRELFELPLLPLSLHILMLFGLGLWMSTVRFGRPEPLPARLGRGRDALIAASARLLDEGAAAGHSLDAYWHDVMRDLAETLSMPAGIGHDERVERLAAIAAQRGLEVDVRAIDDRVRRLKTLPRRRRAQPRVLPVARQIHTLREEILNGYQIYR